MRHKLRAAVAAAALTLASLGATVAAAPPASAAAGTWYAGAVYNSASATGFDRQGIYFTNVGACDSSGYVVDLQGTSLWSTKVSSVTVSNQNGCTAVKITRASDGATWSCYSVCLANAGNTVVLGGGFNDNTRYIRFFRG